MEFVKDFLIYEAGALCGFFIAALMNAARAGQEIAIKFEEDKHGAGEEHPDGAGTVSYTHLFLLLPAY